MGNSQPRYLSERESRDVLGSSTVERLTAQLRCLCDYGSYVDFDIFSGILTAYFEAMPRKLHEILYSGFANDLQSKIEIKDFISGLAAILSSNNDETQRRRFLFRVYDVADAGELDKLRMERVVLLAHGDTISNISIANELKRLFSHSADTRYISLKEFESYSGPTDIISGWVRAVLTIFVEPSSTKLSSLERRYSAALEAEQIVDRFSINRDTCDRLRHIFYRRCQKTKDINSSHGIDAKAELTEAAWVDWTSCFLAPELAVVLFRAKLTGLKHVWRFQEFAEFCIIFGTSHSDETKAAFLCVLFQQYALNCEQRADMLCNNSNSHSANDVADEISTKYEDEIDGKMIPESDFERAKENERNLKDSQQLMSIMRRLVHLLSVPARIRPISPLGDVSEPAVFDELPPIDENIDSRLRALENSFYCSSSENDMDTPDGSLKPNGSATLQAYVSFICDNIQSLPGVQLLSMAACCLFGLRPPSPQLEKVYITELMLWGQAMTTQDADQPHGPDGAEWALIATPWWDTWRYFVGRSNSGSNPPREPGEVNNYTLLKRTSSVIQLQHGLVLKRDFEAVPLHVFTSLHNWYGGGPLVCRKVVSGLKHAGGVPREHLNNATASQCRPLLELFPLCLRIYSCDQHGRPSESYPRELLCSAVSPVSSVLSKLRVDPSRARLWVFDPKADVASGSWRKQYVLIPELSLQEIGLHQDECLLLEVSLSDGSWPKSQLHAQLEAEEARKIGNSQGEPFSPQSPLHQDSNLVLNDGGKVGLDNLGNTCYLNSSLQALLHTPHLVEYFLRKIHLREVNTHSKFGFKGRLACAFGKLASDLWVSRSEKDKSGSFTAATTSAMSTLKSFTTGNTTSSISPRKFRKELMALHDQFNNNEQHDAQEVLTFLLDGLSEDLNRVHEKPYVEQPDSDERTDDVLAQIWWENHLKRDHSVMQALFTGQFKSVTRCIQDGCSYHSARFEPFNMLSVPLPDNEQRVMTVYVMTREGSQLVKCEVLVKKSSDTVSDIETVLRSYGDIPGLEERDNCRFLVFRLSDGRLVHHFDDAASVDTIREVDDIVFYQVLLDKDVLRFGEAERPLTVNAPSQSDMCQQSFKRPLNTSPIPASPTSQSPVHSSKRADTRAETERDRSLIKAGPVLRESMTSSHSSRNQESKTGESDIVEMDISDDCDSASESGLQVRTVTLVHRRVQSSTSHSTLQDSNCRGGLKIFKMEKVGFPLLERLPSRILPSKLYEIIEQRVRHCFKTSILDLQKRNNSGIPVHSVSHRLGGMSNSPSHHVRPIATEDAVGGDIPPFGFVLRLVKANGSCCSRCHWLSRCEGCLIPNSGFGDVSDNSYIELDDMQCIAVDWHYIVFHEALEPFPADNDQMISVTHRSVGEHKRHHSQVLPLQKCLQKFTEEEALDDMVCPKCHQSDGCLKRSFALWRLPPVLIIQLKRFQFNSYSRRKLTNQVNFPFDGLDVSCFMAPSHELFQHLEQNQQISLPQESLNNEQKISPECSDLESSLKTLDEERCLYDLYSTVHHIGALGGGHYVASVKDDFVNLKNHLMCSKEKNNISSSCSSANSSEEKEEVGLPSENNCSDGGSANTPPKSNKWYCYNDSIISATTPQEIRAGSSAYLLFYLRRDVRASSVFALHETHTDAIVDTLDTDAEACPGTRRGEIKKEVNKTSKNNHFDVNNRDVDELSESDNTQCRIS